MLVARGHDAMLAAAARHLATSATRRPTAFATMAAAALREHGVIPDVLPEGTNPTVDIHVTFADGSKVQHGNILTPTIDANGVPPRAQVNKQPQVNWEAKPNKLYTLVLTDPDAPSRADPKFGEWHHWLVLNIPGSDVTKGETRKGYVPSAPPKGSGLHRYVYVLYEHDQPITAPNEPHLRSDHWPWPKLTACRSKHRNNWKVTKFAQENGLGLPVGVNFYRAEWDEIVPSVYASFKDE